MNDCLDWWDAHDWYDLKGMEEEMRTDNDGETEPDEQLLEGEER